VRSILFEQPGVIEAEVNFYAGEAQVIYDRAQVTAAELAEVVATYFPAEVVDDRLAEP
jgi:copper chaperone CopZ